jgi:CubicO group peptidase (beta-lactamase class C family)
MAKVLRDNLDSVTKRAIAEQRIVGTAIIISHNGKIVYEKCAGLNDREAGVAMRAGDTFRLSSLSKPIVAATALATIERGKLGIDDPVVRWIPEFCPKMPNGATPEITVRQLLNHTAGLSYSFLEDHEGPYHIANVSDGLDQPGLSIAENLQRISSVSLLYQPGSSWGYSIASDVLGEVVSRACCCSLADAVSRYVTGPLAMKDTGFTVKDPARLVVPYADCIPIPVRMVDPHAVPFGQGSIQFSPSRALDRHSYASGGCGMVGTARDFMRFLEVLRMGGESILGAELCKMMITDQTSGRGPGPGRAFGFGMSVITEPTAASTPQSAGTFTWGGVYGHSWFVDPSRRLTAVTLTNTAVEGLSGRFPIEVRDTIYESAELA